MSDMIKNEDVKVLGGGGSQIMVEHYSDATRILQIRGFTREATISADMTTSSDNSLVTTIFDIDSIPLMLTARTSGRTVKRGQLYIKVSLLVDGAVVGLLMTGYVSETHKVSYPGGDFEGATDGKGFVKKVQIDPPGAGAEVIITIPDRVKWRVISIKYRFTSSATVASRTPKLHFSQDGDIFFTTYLARTIPASTLAELTYAENSPVFSTVATMHLSYLPPNVYLYTGSIIETDTLLLQVDDFYAVTYLLVEQWINP